MKSLLIIFILLSASFAAANQQPDSPLSRIDPSDKELLSALFEDMIFRDQFGHVLIGEKPTALAGYFEYTPLGNLLFKKKPSLDFKRCWQALKKYDALFSSDNFLITKAIHHGDQEDPSLEIVTIINKKVLLQTMEENIDLFQKVLGSSFDPVIFLSELFQKKTCLFEALHRDEGLYGIALGYGRENALAYKRRQELIKLFHPLYRDMSLNFSLYLPRVSKEFSSLEEEYFWFENNLVGIDLKLPFTWINPPPFMAFIDSKETAFLKKKYLNAQRKLMTVYGNKDILEVVIEQLHLPSAEDF